MADLTPDQVYEMVSNFRRSELEHRKQADFYRKAREWLMDAVDGDPGITRTGLAAASGVSTQRVQHLLGPIGEREGSPGDAVPVLPVYRPLIEEAAPELGRARKIRVRGA